MRNHEEAVRGAYEAEFLRATAAVAALWQLLLFYQVWTYRDAFRHPLVPILVWCGLLAAATWLVPHVGGRNGGLTLGEAVVAVAIAALASGVVGSLRLRSAFSWSVDWSQIGVYWLLVLVAVSRGARLWVPGALLVYGVHAFFVLHVAGGSRMSLTRLAASAYGLILLLTVFAVLRRLFRTYAGLATRRTALESQSMTERASAAAIGANRRDRLAVLEDSILPLLRGVADGTYADDDEDVRDLSTRHVVQLRAALMREPEPSGVLLDALDPALRDALRRGIPTEIQVIGDPGEPSSRIVRATAAAVGDVLRLLEPRPVILTVLASGAEVELFLSFDTPLREPPNVSSYGQHVSAPISWCAMIDTYDSGGGCLEVRWPKAVPT